MALRSCKYLLSILSRRLAICSTASASAFFLNPAVLLKLHHLFDEAWTCLWAAPAFSTVRFVKPQACCYAFVNIKFLTLQAHYNAIADAFVTNGYFFPRQEDHALKFARHDAMRYGQTSIPTLLRQLNASDASWNFSARYADWPSF